MPLADLSPLPESECVLLVMRYVTNDTEYSSVNADEKVGYVVHNVLIKSVNF